MDDEQDPMEQAEKPAPHSRSGKVLRALGGDDEFSTMSVDPRRRKPPVQIVQDQTGRPADTRASRTVLRFLRKIFRE
jgi:hypothetical protein